LPPDPISSAEQFYPGEFTMAIVKSDAHSGSARTGLLARYPLTFFFVIAFAGTWLVWSLFVLSQDGARLMPFRSPMTFMAIMCLGQVFGPTLAAFVMTGVTEGKAGLRHFIGRIFEWRVGIQWYLFVLIGIPAIMSLGTIVLPGIWPSFKPFDNPISELVSYLIFYIYPALIIGGPLFEELGWRGFALSHLQERYGPMAASLILGILWAFWHLPIWFSGQWTVPTIQNIAFFVFWITAVTFIMTWVFNNTKDSVLIAILAHASMDAFPNAIVWPLFPAASKITDHHLLYGYLGLALGYGVTALSIIIFTRGRLGYQHCRPESGC
jgi:membrane protease YdiL (CAAX protease family)